GANLEVEPRQGHDLVGENLVGSPERDKRRRIGCRGSRPSPGRKCRDLCHLVNQPACCRAGSSRASRNGIITPEGLVLFILDSQSGDRALTRGAPTPYPTETPHRLPYIIA